MTAPTIRSQQDSYSTANGTSHTNYQLPASINPLDPVLAIFTTDFADSYIEEGDFDDGGWTRLYAVRDNTCTAFAFKRIADASFAARAGSNLSFTIYDSVRGSNSEQYTGSIFSFSGAHGDIAVSAAYDNGLLGTDGILADPILFNTVTPPWGAADNLYLAALHKYNGGLARVRQWPSGYSNTIENFGASLVSQRPTMAISVRSTIGSSSENPGTMTVGSDDPPTTDGYGGTSFVFAIRPANAGSGLMLPSHRSMTGGMIDLT